ASAVVAGHFGEIVLGHADELMTREQAGQLLERARATSPTLVDEVVPGLLRAGELQRVLQNLLRERVSIRDVETILETLAVDAGPLVEMGYPPAVLTSAEARPVLKDLTRADLPRLVVLSQREIPRDTPIESYGVVIEEELPVSTSVSTSTGVAVH